LARAAVRLPKLVGDGMVLQRDARIAVWGWADPGEKVRVRFHGDDVRVGADANGRWRVEMGPYPAGGPYEVEVDGTNRIVIRDVLVGDVWLASGQSNMEFPVDAGGRAAVDNGKAVRAAANFPDIRLFRLTHATASSPREDAPS